MQNKSAFKDLKKFISRKIMFISLFPEQLPSEVNPTKLVSFVNTHFFTNKLNHFIANIFFKCSKTL